MYDARQIANWFVNRARRDGRTLSIMKLLKLVYIAHGWYLEMSGSPLIRNKIEAWKHGPVIPDVYRAFRPQGIDVANAIPNFSPDFNAYVDNVLEQIYGIYGAIPAGRLSEMTHEPGGPWDTASKRFGYFAPITNDVILTHYRQKRVNRVN
ncbi:Panacea domain-containing protein [Agrobacterium tumefaciens]|uniref:Panacea domain-containing protein n=1 Tax=Agrobacterium tumefaciens TaxID=358 RepID=UPI0005548E14|nr:type II toxin-antitoxin system antitoxin SocA domain-containing protein [Agrobacterium tumefaciens]